MQQCQGGSLVRVAQLFIVLPLPSANRTQGNIQANRIESLDNDQPEFRFAWPGYHSDQPE